LILTAQLFIKMQKKIDLKLTPAEAADPIAVKAAAAMCTGWTADEITVVLLRRSIDARSRQPYILLQVEVFCDEMPPVETPALANLRDVTNSQKVLIIGAGPAGYFAALELIAQGLKPIVLDRGKDVQARRRDLRAIQQDGIVNPNSNYCFGEGGAGTYSDGKLYTRSVKRGDWWKSLKILVEHGANPDILVEAHPHIGSNKLPIIVAEMRKTIEKYGGEVHFNSLVTDFVIDKNQVFKGVIVNTDTEYLAQATILATGHSARDIYYLCQQKNVLLEEKSYALGVRIEHPQALIDTIQYRQTPRDILLPAASYKVVCQVPSQKMNVTKGVFSFCMCPGGLVVPAATAPGELVVNGMSMSRRDSPFANSGTVTSIETEDIQAYAKHGIFAGLEFQKNVEQKIWQAGDGSQKAAAQRLTDFVNRKVSNTLGDTSYIPGLWSAPMHQLLPKHIYDRLREGVVQFGKQMRGYYTEEAQVIGTESRTSSPLRIPRDAETLMHPQTSGLFPCGEGAGFAGGILSAAMDGQNVAAKIAVFLKK
jgi:uncharacterized protein